MKEIVELLQEYIKLYKTRLELISLKKGTPVLINENVLCQLLKPVPSILPRDFNIENSIRSTFIKLKIYASSDTDNNKNKSLVKFSLSDIKSWRIVPFTDFPLYINFPFKTHYYHRVMAKGCI